MRKGKKVDSDGQAVEKVDACQKPESRGGGVTAQAAPGLEPRPGHGPASPPDFESLIACLDVPTALIPGHLIKTERYPHRPIASLWVGGGSKGVQSQRDYAHLFAAAPELYAELLDLVAQVQRYTADDDVDLPNIARAQRLLCRVQREVAHG